jgi:hypothetical protein
MSRVNVVRHGQRCWKGNPNGAARTRGFWVGGRSGLTPSGVPRKLLSWAIPGLVLLVPGCWDGPSPLGLSELAEVSAVAVIGTRAAPDFAQTGRLSLVVIPMHEGEVVPPQAVREVTVHAASGPTQGTVTGTRVREPRTDGEIAGAVLLDSSRSMLWNDPGRLRVDAGQLFVDELEKARRSKGVPFMLGVFDFSGAGFSSGRFRYTRVLQEYTTEVEALRQGVARTIASGDTPLFGSASEVIEELGRGFPGGAYRRVVLLLSDGDDTRPSAGTLDMVVDAAHTYDVVIISVSLGQADEQVLQKMAQESGGTSIKVEEAADLMLSLGLQAYPLTQSYLEAEVRLNPVPPPGTAVALRLDVNSGFRPVSTSFVFTAP